MSRGPWCPGAQLPQLGPAAACTTGYGAAAPPAAAAQCLAGPRTVRQRTTPDLALWCLLCEGETRVIVEGETYPLVVKV